WQRHGWEGGFLGYPTTSDMALGNQWFKQYFQGGHVYTHNALPASQASIQGAIYDKWQSMGAQYSELGYPISIDDVWTMPPRSASFRMSQLTRVHGRSTTSTCAI